MGRSKLSFNNKEKKINTKIIKSIILWIFEIAVVVVTAWVLVYYIGQKTENMGSSMEPTIRNGQEVWINRMSYLLSTPKRYDVIVFYPNGNRNSGFMIKRVVALPGETVQIQDGKILVDNKELTDDVIQEKIIDPGDMQEAYTLQTEEYFVLGDNRNSSEDSRYADMGMVSLGDIAGKAWFRTGKGSTGLIR